MQKNILGKTGLEVSLLGFGGFHLLEIPAEEAEKLLKYYLENGGNYIETAASYGNGESEKKIGPIISKYREEIVLASKTGIRSADGAMEEINRSLENLHTDYLDILFIHGVTKEEDLQKVISPGGALYAALEAKKMGKVRHIGITSHGQPDVLIDGLKTGHFEVMMTHFNYFDRFNFPSLENVLLPLTQEKNIGTICMKPLADGFLWRSIENAFRYVFSLPIDMVVTGMNSMEMLKTDIEIARNYNPMTENEINELFASADELGNYICRQCNNCTVSEEWGESIKEVFKVEGYYDRQMYDGKPRNPAEYALRDRLRFWFGNKDMACKVYKALSMNARDLLGKVDSFSECKYSLPIKSKLNMINYKMGKSDVLQ
ncbi:MAG: aldo/keto reductase [Halanaerobiaceae bacterium]